jgi:transglutaminase-like putative cysteine protease
MLYRTKHVTRHLYQEPVSQCFNELRLTPRSFPGQRVVETDLRIQPEPESIDRRKDYFGNEVTSFAVFEMHDRFIVTASSLVEVEPVTPPNTSSIAWEDARDRLITQPDTACLVASEFVFDSPFVSAGKELAGYARPTFAPGRPLTDALRELSRRIRTEFRYAPKSTSIDMPLLEVLTNRRGVCQDFAHIMIGAVRSMGLAARYVSGYLRSGTKYVGAEASHAWVSVFVPGSGWLSYDPTNDVIPSDGHITLAWGRDYGDVTPVKGVTLGGGGQTVEVDVSVVPAQVAAASRSGAL